MAVASGSDTEHLPAKQFVSNLTNFSAPGMDIRPTLDSVCLSLNATAFAASPLSAVIPACDPAASVTVLSEADPDSPLNPVVFPGLATTQSPWAVITPWLDFDRARLIPTLDDVVLTRYIARRIMPDSVRGQWTDTNAALSGGGRLYIGPPGDAAERLADALNQTSKLFKFVFGGVVTEDEMVELATNDKTAAAFWGGIVVSQFDAAGLKYALRMNRTMLPLSGSLRSQYASSNGLGAHYMGVFFATGTTTLQNLIAAAYLNITHSVAALPDESSDGLLQAAIAPMPYEQYEKNDFLESAGGLMPLAIVLGFLYCVSQLTRLLVEEKELRVREAMLIMGLGHVPFYLSWFIPYIAMHVVISAVITIIVKATFLPNSNGGIIFFLFFFFGLSTISLSVFFSSLFSKARIAALVAPVLFFIMAIPSFALGDDAPASSKMGLTILPPSAFGVGCQLLFNYELIGGIHARNLGNDRDDVPMIVALIMLIIDTLLYLLVGLYLEAVLPSEWGVPMHPLCCLGPCITDKLRRIRNCVAGVPDRVDDLDDEPIRNAAGVADGRDPRGAFEAQPQRQPSVQLLGVRKDFETPAGRMRAVRDLTMDLYEGDVNVVLGHNGAGKTTAISCITGMIDMTEGDCLVYGRSVRHELDAVRQLIGFCPQHNILWPELTCREHLRFYCVLKGLTGNAVNAEIEMLLKSVDLLEKADYPAGGMSGGQKRKLSVAIAFCGGSKLVFLDEPTAGMDVGARRFTWDLIRRMSAGRTIVLTTHFMDEADLLGNTISIMSRGMLKCQGSSTFLKARFGVGYTLSVALAPSHQNQAGHNALVQIAKGFVAGAEQVHGSHAEVIMRLPTDQVPHFPPLLRALEDRAHELGTLGFGVSVTTLEEVFVRIGHDEAPARAQPAAELTPMPGKVASVVEESVDSARASLPGAVVDMRTSRSEAAGAEAKELDVGEPLYQADEEARSDVPFSAQLRVLLIKRFHATRRDARTLVLQVVVPILCLIFAMLLAGLKFPDQPALLLAPSSYGGTESDMTGCAAALATTQADWTLHMRNVSGPAGLSAYLLSTFFQHASDRVSGFACGDPAYVVDPVAPVVFSNETFSHGAAVALADFNLMRMRLATGNPSLVVEVYHHPMPFTDFMNAMITAFTSILVGIMILVPFTFIPSIYVSFIVKETETQSKHLQQVSGMQFFPYWVSNFIFDFCSFLVTDVLAIIVFLIFDRKEYIGDATAFGATASLLLFYTLSSIMMAYALSFAFTSHSAAQNTVMMTNFVAGFILVLLVFILGLMDSTKDVADPLRFVLRLIPAFALGDGIIKLAFLSATASLTGNTDSPFSFEHIGYDLLYMGLLVPFFALLTLFLDHPSGSTALARVIRHWRRGGDDEKETPASEMTGMPRPGEAVEMEDPDVAREREEIESGKRANDLVVVKNLVKSFGSKVAVKGITFGIHPGEVFGFLGTNGAGKTTTMSILCGQLAPTSGTGWVAGKNVESEMAEVRRVIGYCPQFDAILELLTVEEHLFLFSGLRGLPAGPVQERVVNRLIKMCDLEMHRKKTAGSLSGGNKRKLSVAIALIGAPKVVFLDEPSAGMDPMARHGMWDVIEGMAKSCCVVLTTHHLEEVEALANRVAIMVGGTMKCVGSLQHLKTKFGSGFELTVRLDNEAAVTAADTYIRKQIPNAKMQEQRMTKLTYALPSDVKLSEVFAAIEDQKATLQIADYTVAQTSLEQVFLRIGGSDALESE